MAINKLQIRFIIQEHLRKSLKGSKVVTWGRQSVQTTFEEAVALCIEEGYNPSKELLNKILVKQDTITRGAGEIDDNTLFALFEVASLDSIDRSDYENATILHDLNQPIPEELKEKFDYLIDGGVLDHLINIGTAMENMGSMLKLGGRIFGWDVSTNCTVGSYCVFTPAFFFDWFAINNYENCRTFMVEGYDLGMHSHIALYAIDPTKLDKYFFTSRFLTMHFFAQKRIDGTTTLNKLPVVEDYRMGLDAEVYKKIANESATPFCLTALFNDINVIQNEGKEYVNKGGYCSLQNEENQYPRGEGYLSPMGKKKFMDSCCCACGKLTGAEQMFGLKPYNPASTRGYQFIHYFRNI